jgi:hypothetical protein
MSTSTELTQNYDQLNTPHDPNQPIETLFQQIQDKRGFAVAGGQTYGDVMMVNVAFALVFNTGLFPDARRAWKVRPASQKTCTNFKVSSLASHREFGNKPDCTSVRVLQRQNDD